MKSLLLFLVILPLVSRMLDGRYLLVDVNENVHQNLTAEGMLASRQEGESCGQSTTEDCGDCNKGFICSTWESPMIPHKCGICKPEQKRKDAFDLTLAKKENRKCREPSECSSLEKCCDGKCVSPADPSCVPTNVRRDCEVDDDCEFIQKCCWYGCGWC